MSTKASIKQRGRTTEQPGFHLYEDVLDGLAAEGVAGAKEPPVYLHLDGVAAELQTLSNGGATITLELPREMARTLGLLPSEPHQERPMVQREPS